MVKNDKTETVADLKTHTVGKPSYLVKLEIKVQG